MKNLIQKKEYVAKMLGGNSFLRKQPIGYYKINQIIN